MRGQDLDLEKEIIMYSNIFQPPLWLIVIMTRLKRQYNASSPAVEKLNANYIKLNQYYEIFSLTKYVKRNSSWYALLGAHLITDAKFYFNMWRSLKDNLFLHITDDGAHTPKRDISQEFTIRSGKILDIFCNVMWNSMGEIELVKELE